MSITTSTQTTLQGDKGGMALDGRPTDYNDFRDQLNRDGYAVIKGAIPRDRADRYADKFLSYIEDLYVFSRSHLYISYRLMEVGGQWPRLQTR